MNHSSPSAPSYFFILLLLALRSIRFLFPLHGTYYIVVVPCQLEQQWLDGGGYKKRVIVEIGNNIALRTAAVVFPERGAQQALVGCAVY